MKNEKQTIEIKATCMYDWIVAFVLWYIHLFQIVNHIVSNYVN